jgi:hypothetical protein
MNGANNELHLEKMYPISSHSFQKKKTAQSQFRQGPGSLLTLIKKELLVLWRNPHYRRLKIFTYLFYLTVQISLYFSTLANNDMWMMFFSAAIFWIHYNVHFNSKYVSPDPEWFFRTIPLRFSQIWFAKFATEILYILFLLLNQLLFLALVGNEAWILLNWIGALLLFALIILSIVINFQILFYDNPRQAGYTYHFTILFIGVTSANYRLVGPIMALFVLTYFFYKTYRFYNS